MWQNKNDKHSFGFVILETLKYSELPAVNICWSVRVFDNLRSGFLSTHLFFFHVTKSSPICVDKPLDLDNQKNWGKMIRVIRCPDHKMRVPLVGVIKGCKWASSATQLSVLSCYRSADSIYITFVAKRMMRMRMTSTTTPIIIIILMFFHQYFLATLVDVLWNESAWKTKQGNPNKQTEGRQNFVGRI